MAQKQFVGIRIEGDLRECVRDFLDNKDVIGDRITYSDVMRVGLMQMGKAYNIPVCDGMTEQAEPVAV